MAADLAGDAGEKEPNARGTKSGYKYKYRANAVARSRLRGLRLTLGPTSCELKPEVWQPAGVLQSCLLGPHRDWDAALQWRASVLPQLTKAQ